MITQSRHDRLLLPSPAPSCPPQAMYYFISGYTAKVSWGERCRPGGALRLLCLPLCLWRAVRGAVGWQSALPFGTRPLRVCGVGRPAPMAWPSHGALRWPGHCGAGFPTPAARTGCVPGRGWGQDMRHTLLRQRGAMQRSPGRVRLVQAPSQLPPDCACLSVACRWRARSRA